MHLALLACAAALLAACAAPVPAPAGPKVHSVALRPVVNKTGQFGLEDPLMLRLRDELLRDGRCPLVSEGATAEGVAVVTITRYLAAPVQYDENLAPLAYRLRVAADLDLRDGRKPDQALWTEKGFEGLETYAAPGLAGGQREEQAREGAFDTLARDIVKRIAAGCGR